MNQNTIFTVRNEDLSLFNPDTAVEFFQKLLWAEARRLGTEISKVNISRWGNVSDRGVDATVEAAQFDGGQGLIKPGKTSYQTDIYQKRNQNLSVAPRLAGGLVLRAALILIRNWRTLTRLFMGPCKTFEGRTCGSRAKTTRET